VINFIQVGEGTYFYCIDCAEGQGLKGKIKDYRFDTDNNSIRRVQCFLCGKHTQIFIQGKEIKKTYEYQTVSTRPSCPICGLGTLTGYLTNTMQAHIEYSTICENKECHATVFLDGNWKVSYARTRDGGFFIYTGGEYGKRFNWKQNERKL